MNCERCTATTSGYQLFDYCASCSKNLCEKCMTKGCCGRSPAASGSADEREATIEAIGESPLAETEGEHRDRVEAAEHDESCPCETCVDAELADLTRDHAEQQRRLAAKPEAIDADQYQRMLEVLPPARWIGGAFLVGEAMSHDEDGQARYAYYFRRGDQHFHGADLTIAEFEAKHGKGG